jgi:hypothetical protein
LVKIYFPPPGFVVAGVAAPVFAGVEEDAPFAAEPVVVPAEVDAGVVAGFCLFALAFTFIM